MLSHAERRVTIVVLGLAAIVTLYPLVVLVSVAFGPLHGSSSGITFNHPFSTAAFGYAWREGSFSRYMLNTAIVTVSVVAVSAVLSIMAGYAVAVLRPPGSRLILYVSIFGFMLPVEALIVPWYYQFLPLNLVDTYWAMILPQIAQSVAFGTFWLHIAFRALPATLSESAALDGASRWTALWRVLTPNVAPAVRTMAALVFLWTWNSFMLPLVMVSNQSLYVVTIGLSNFQGSHFNNYSALAAGSILAALPVVLVYLASQRTFVSGMLAGSVVE
jgi:raffinose/stachyose/melibiose transport system permease protein